MPFVRVSLPRQLADAQLGSISDAVHEAMVRTFNVPAKDRFQVLTRHAPGELVCAAEYLDIHHGDQVAFVQITCNEGRTLDMKKALFAQLAAGIAAASPIRQDDVIVGHSPRVRPRTARCLCRRTSSPSLLRPS